MPLKDMPLFRWIKIRYSYKEKNAFVFLVILGILYLKSLQLVETVLPEK